MRIDTESNKEEHTYGSQGVRCVVRNPAACIFGLSSFDEGRRLCPSQMGAADESTSEGVESGCGICVVDLSEIRARGGENTHCTREDSEALLEVQSLGIEEISPAFLSRDYQYRVLTT